MKQAKGPQFIRFFKPVKEDRKPVAVILDYSEYVRLKEIEQDRVDYYSAIEAKRKNRKWTSHADLKKALGL